MANEQQRILIVDDHPLFREGLSQMIERNAEWKVCGEASDAAEAHRLVRELQPDLVIIDISLGASSGIDLIKSLKAQDDDLPILVISMHDETLFAERAMRAKAMGYVMKHEPAKTVQAAIAKVLSGNIYLSEKMSSAMLSKFMLGKEDEPGSAIESLSDRELEVFRMLGQGKGTRQIAKELNLSIATINSFRARIKEKLSLKSSSELVLHAMRHCLQEGANAGGG
ncbi:MAG TPA: response regulator transcription factor [Verrucomicrobiae bacterium]|jgi:DNA-binding NarL/FixJ family response regulator|nr:response regulator transcription factor [Verrucomicrobiae bacterium]